MGNETRAKNPVSEKWTQPDYLTDVGIAEPLVRPGTRPALGKLSERAAASNVELLRTALPSLEGA